ncbi:armadillo-type protein [Lentinula detonsa]|uniref:Armadillo-type protein n=1 Tax=Lentinula detonsa TaxID=2804962 RepID=A0A9W8U1R2_9AGAR|nr:armadillo-type protein [Lentinula detonsa]
MSFVPFISSGASSRLHYVLVRKVETAASPQAVDDIVSAEIQSLVQKVSETRVSSSVCREYLIMLLYCITVSTVSLPALDAVLPHAVNLAEAGSNISEKQIGYLFCAEMMPVGHELQLMLVNTLRKDLESIHLANISLALNHLIQCPSVDVIPAIQSHLQNLLVHNSPQIRRRALLALKALSVFDSDIMSKVHADIMERIKDPDDSVCNAALITASRLCEVHEPGRLVVQDALNNLLCEIWSTHKEGRRSVLIRLLDTLRTLEYTEFDVSLLDEMIQLAVRLKDNALLRSAFLCLPPVQAQIIFPSSNAVSPLVHVRSLLTSNEPNQRYLFLTCLECLDPQLWAGTTPDVPAVLEQWEVEHIMGYLHSRDAILRRKTLRVLDKVDPRIVSSYYRAALQNFLNQPTDGKTDHELPLFEVLEIQAGIDGERYARDVLILLGHIETPSSRDDHISESIVAIVLTRIRQSSDEFRRVASGYLLSSLLNTKTRLGSTTMVIIGALACENSGQLSLSWVRILEGLSSRIESCPIPVQDASLLSMLRIAADCSEVPQQVLDTVLKLKEASGRYIRRRCEQFIRLSSDRETLLRIVHNARSSTLPDFVEALQSYQAGDNPPSSSSYSRGSQNHSLISESLSTSKLRYSAYDAPVPTPRLQGRKTTNSNYGSEPSILGSPRGFALPELVAGGELALVASTTEFESEMSATIGGDKPSNTISNTNDTTTRNDLIAFDSPFIAEPFENSPTNFESPVSQLSFDNIWESFSAEARGWYEKPIDQLVRRMQIMDPSNVDVSLIEAALPPFLGELKVTLRFKPHTYMSSCAVLRLRESEENSSLWKLRGDVPLYATVKNILTEDAGHWV